LDLVHRILVALSITLIAGCASAPPINSINSGMTRQEVIEIMGQPSRVKNSAGAEVLFYEVPKMDPETSMICMGAKVSRQLYTHPECRDRGEDTYFVTLTDGRVVGHGRSELTATHSPPALPENP
jgi:hypothetical protein